MTSTFKVQTAVRSNLNSRDRWKSKEGGVREREWKRRFGYNAIKLAAQRLMTFSQTTPRRPKYKIIIIRVYISKHAKKKEKHSSKIKLKSIKSTEIRHSSSTTKPTRLFICYYRVLGFIYIWQGEKRSKVMEHGDLKIPYLEWFGFFFQSWNIRERANWGAWECDKFLP